MDYCALVRPPIDRVYSSVRMAARPRVREAIGHRVPGLLTDFHFGLLARPMPAAAFKALTIYRDGDVREELAAGLITVDGDGTIALTETGTLLALDIQCAIGDGAQEHWSRVPLAELEELNELLGVLLKATTGGPAFEAMAPPYEPGDATVALRLSTRLGAFRHHRADAHRAAWQGAGVTLDQLRAMSPDRPERIAIEEETNRRDEPIYEALTEAQRWKFLAVLARLP